MKVFPEYQNLQLIFRSLAWSGVICTTRKTDLFLRFNILPCGLVARIRRFHRRGRGSIPRKGETVILAEFVIPEKPCFKSDKRQGEI